MDENTRNIYKENVDLIESLRIYKREFEQLQKSKEKLTKELTQISNDRQLNEHLIKEKIEQVQQQRKTIKDAKDKIQSLEKSLKQLVDEFQVERTKLIEQSEIESESSRNEIEKLQRALELKAKEMNKVKKLGKTILEQRTELESLFYESLNAVKKQILLQRLQSKKDSLENYHQTHSDHPRMRTFHETFQDLTTQSVFRDLDGNHRW